MMALIARYRTEIVLALVALVWHLVCFSGVIAANNGDVVQAIRADDGYFELAQNVLQGNGYSMATSAPYHQNPLRTPGFIAFIVALWAITGTAVGASIAQLLLGSLIPILGMHIAQKVSGSRTVGIVAGVILALDPTLSLLSFQLYTETLFLVLFYAWLLLMWRYSERPSWSAIVVGALLLGSATMVKASTQFIPVLVVIGIMWHAGKHEWRLGLARSAVFVAIFGAVLAPWVLHNVRTYGAPGLTTQTPYVLYTNFAPAVLTVANGSDFWTTVTTFSTQAERDGWVITFTNSEPYVEKAVEVIRAHPAASLFVMAKSLVTFFTHDGVNTLVVRSGHDSDTFLPIVVVMRLFWIALTLAAGIGGLVLLLKRPSLMAIACITLVAYFATTSMLAAFGTNPRYRLPVDPILIALAAIGVAYIRNYLRTFRRSS